MKRWFLALSILSAALAGTGAFRGATTRLRQEMAAGYEAWRIQTQLVVQARSERVAL